MRGAIAQTDLQLQGVGVVGGKRKMMMAGGGGAAVDHNGIYSNPNLHSLQQPSMEAENADSRKRPLETSVEEAGCTKRTNVGGRRCTARSSSATASHLHLVKSVDVEAFLYTGVQDETAKTPFSMRVQEVHTAQKQNRLKTCSADVSFGCYLMFQQADQVT